MNELSQKHLGKKRTYIIEEKGLRYQRFDEGKYIDELYKWENIGFEEIIISQLPSKFEYLLFGSLLMNLLTLTIPFTLDGNDKARGVVIGVFTVFTIFLSKKLFVKKYEKIISGGYSVNFFYFDNHKKEVDNFIEILKKTKIDYLKKKYLNKENYDNLETYYNRISWLREEEIITDEEYQTLRNRNTSIQGFSK